MARGDPTYVVFDGDEYKWLRWELDLALELGLPIVAVNLNEKRFKDPDRCPPIIRDECAVHIPFKMKAIKFALDNWPGEFNKMEAAVGCPCL